MGRLGMKIKPVSPVFSSFDRDERQDAEERRYKLIFEFLADMNVPAQRCKDLVIPEKRSSALQWLNRNLGIYNSHHKNYKRTINLIHLSLKRLA